MSRGLDIAPSTAQVKLRHTPALDGVRGAAVLVVFLSHLNLPIYGGQVGVNIFFVLSGFLITHLLLEELLGRGRIAFGNFYARRALRLYPALTALVVVVTVYSLFPGAIRSEESLTAIPAVLLYFGNWVRAFSSAESPLGLYEHTWSLSIEEQFYLTWPLLLVLCFALTRSVRALAWLAGGGIVASVLTRVLIEPGVGGDARLYNGLDTQADQLLYGALLAVLVVGADEERRARAAVWLRRLFWPAALALGLAVLLWPSHGTSIGFRLVVAGIGLAAMIVVGYCYLVSDSWPIRVLSSPLGRYLGRRSYALYLWHYPTLTVCLAWQTEGAAAAVGKRLIGLVLAFVAAELSYRFVERPFLRLKDRLRQEERRGAGAGVAPE